MSTYTPDELLVVRGFRVEIDGPDGREVDSAWETCSGGSLNIEVADDPGKPSPKSVTTLVLRGPLTAGRRWLARCLNEASGESAATRKEPKRFNLTLVELLRDGSVGRRFNYLECFITRYSPPSLSASGTGNLYEEVHIKPIRLELA